MIGYVLAVAQMRELGLDVEDYRNMPDDEPFLILAEEEVPSFPDEARCNVRIGPADNE